jgi:hypothetical protein
MNCCTPWALKHEGTEYSMMNYGPRPWATGDLENMMVPLPDDREALRVLYPGRGEACDLAVYNTWVNPGLGLTKGAVEQDRLCEVSGGSDFSASPFPGHPQHGGPYCRQGGTDNVCPGDTVYSRYTVANHGTDTQTAMHTLWFSTNPGLNRTIDLEARGPGVRHYAAESTMQESTFTVPYDVEYGETYYAIVEVLDEGTTETFTRNNHIPLRGQLTIKSALECGDFSTEQRPKSGAYQQGGNEAGQTESPQPNPVDQDRQGNGTQEFEG